MTRRGRTWYALGGRSRTSLVVSVGIHVVVAIALLNIVFHYPIGSLGVPRPEGPVPERLRYVRVAPEPAGGGPASAVKSPAPSPPATVRLRAPVRVPVGIPQPSPSARAAAPGPVDRRGGAGRPGDVTAATGVQPAYTDPRLWPDPGPFTPLPKTAAERTDSAVKAAFGIFADSMRTAEANKGRSPTDWTFEKGGQKWGVDDRWIHLGKLKIPNAVLALLPMNAQANPQMAERAKQDAYMRSDILYHADRAISEDEFRRAVKRIRERRDRERASAKGDKANGDGSQPVATPGKAQN